MAANVRRWPAASCRRPVRSRRSWSTTARSSGTDAAGYLTESPGFSTFVRDDGAVYRRVLDDLARIGVPAGLLRNLDRALKGRDDGEAWQLWIRRQDEYESM